ncbi:hypothetical protein [Kitasatospora sp. NPDC088548]|uniref:hypothetical protein n=1 Tax=Kitasatospora sp. NPDC088548 TaxID=3364075 RepID=UPI00380F49EA
MSQPRSGVTARALKYAALCALLSTTFEAVHGLADHWVSAALTVSANSRVSVEVAR